MGRGSHADWEAGLAAWARAPDETDRERWMAAAAIVRGAVAKSAALRRVAWVFVYGAHRNGVGGVPGRPIDIGVVHSGCRVTGSEADIGRLAVGDAAAWRAHRRFKTDLEAALGAFVGRGVARGERCVELRGIGGGLDVDVAPFGELAVCDGGREVRRGVALLTEGPGRWLDRYPERLAGDWPATRLHYENGVARDAATGGAYRGAVRILKALRRVIEDEGPSVAGMVPGYLAECLLYNVPEKLFAGSWWAIMQWGLRYVMRGMEEERLWSRWTEPDGINPLFGRSQRWSRAQAHAFAEEALRRVDAGR